MNYINLARRRMAVALREEKRKPSIFTGIAARAEKLAQDRLDAESPRVTMNLRLRTTGRGIWSRCVTSGVHIVALRVFLSAETPCGCKKVAPDYGELTRRPGTPRSTASSTPTPAF